MRSSRCGLTGSIGVFVVRPVLRAVAAKLDVGVETFTRGSLAPLLLASQPLSERSRGWLHSEVASIYDLFLSRVAEGRKRSTEEISTPSRAAACGPASRRSATGWSTRSAVCASPCAAR